MLRGETVLLMYEGVSHGWLEVKKEAHIPVSHVTNMLMHTSHNRDVTIPACYNYVKSTFAL